MNKLKYKYLGSTKIKCPIIGFGGAPIGNLFKKLKDDEANQILKISQKNKINLYDTSPFYGYGLSEVRLGKFLKKIKRDNFIISTKVGRYLVPEKPNLIKRGIFKGGLNLKPIIDYSYSGVMRSFEQSLNRLQLDHIDICLIHDVDHFTHGRDTMKFFKQSLKGAYRALQKLKDEKLIKAIGLGLNDAEIADKFLHTEKFDCVLLAGRYTLLDKSAEKKFLQTAYDKNVGVMLGGVFNSGILAKGFKNSTYFYKKIPNEIKVKYKLINEICQKNSVPIQAAAIQFCLRNKAVTSLILGIDEIHQIRSNLKFLNFKINHEFWNELAQVF